MESVLRVAFIYLTLLLCFRIMGKRELGQLSQFELVTLMLIPEIVSQGLTRNDASMTNAVIGVATLLTLVMGTSLLVYVSPKAADALEGRPTVLICRGQIQPRAMNRERISAEELASAMHQAGLERVDQVEWAILEPEGRLAIIPASGEGTNNPQEPIRAM